MNVLSGALQMRDEDCPFNEVDHLSIKENVIWMKSQSQENKKSIIEHRIFSATQRGQK